MKIAEVDLLKESTYQTPCGTIHYWSNNLSLDTTTLVFLPGLTADHRLFDKQVEYFDGKYNIIVWSPQERDREESCCSTRNFTFNKN